VTFCSSSGAARTWTEGGPLSRVLFVCVQNAGRSQMAEALFRSAAEGRHEARSAGTAPAAQVHPEVVAAMRELGIGLESRVPHELDQPTPSGPT
jgi:arsenate reductase